MSSLLKKIKSYFQITVSFLADHPFIRCFVLAFITLFLSETMSRHSFIEPWAFLFRSPLAFLFNYLIILLTFSVALFFKRESFAITITASFWLGMSLVNGIILFFRLTPFSAIDFSIAINMLGIIDIYLNIFQLILIILGIIALILLLILIWKKTSKTKVFFVRSGIFTISILICLILTGVVGKYTGLLDKKFPNLAQAYKDYGFAYCFSLSVFDVGIDQPAQYCDNVVDKILDEIDHDINIPPENTPNVLIVQLESFFDINRVSNLITSTNPQPTLTYLKENYPHGVITVPSIGGGTANVEFEILTGMNLEHFGPGEYPYKTVLKSQTCETPAFTLKEYGYTSHAIHNHTATFYDRFAVYPALGFDTFTPLEMMCNPEYNMLGWAKDEILTQEILSCLKSTEGRDFVFTVSVQPHGKFPTENVVTEYGIQTSLKNVDDEDINAQYSYYVDQLHGTDKFIANLIKELSELDEPTAVLFYGDHFPTIYIEDENLLEGTKYQTDYVIWANYDIEQENKNLNAYQLTSHFFDTLGSNLGTTTKVHQYLSSSLNYQDKLEMIEYDMLYGDKNVFKDKIPYEKTEMAYGSEDVYVTDIVLTDDNITIYGNKFNEWTKVRIDGKLHDILYISDRCIRVENINTEEAEQLQIVLITSERLEMRTSAEYTINSFTDTY